MFLKKWIWARPDVKPTTKISSRQERSINSLIEIANQNDVGDAFKILLDAAIANNFYPRISKSSMMYTPQSNRSRCLFTTWVNPLDGLLRVYVASSAYSEFFDVEDAVMCEKIGDEGWRKMDAQEANEFANLLTSLLS